MVSKNCINFAVSNKKQRNMERLKNEKVQEKVNKLCDVFYYEDICDEIEETLGLENGYGSWQEYVTIVPNISLANGIVEGVKPLFNGMFWNVYDAKDLTEDMVKRLLQADMWYIDYITYDQFFD